MKAQKPSLFPQGMGIAFRRGAARQGRLAPHGKELGFHPSIWRYLSQRKVCTTVLSRSMTARGRGRSMTANTPVKVSSRSQIVVPHLAREQQKIKKGDGLLVDAQYGLFALMPCPKN